MYRILTSLSIAVALSAGAVAQCLQVSGTNIGYLLNQTSGVFYPPLDEGLTDPIQLPFTFPMAGVASTLSHVSISSNCELYLSNGSSVSASLFGINNLSDLRGSPGAAPRIACHGRDNDGSQAGVLRLATSTPGQATITWENWAMYGFSATWTVAATLFADGRIRLDYGSGISPYVPEIVGVSIGNGVGSAATPASDLSASGDSGALGLVYEAGFSSAFDIEETSVMFTPNGNGGYSHSLSCGAPSVPASNTNFGVGCYEIARQCFYQQFVDASASSNTLDGHAMELTPNATADGYDVTWLPSAAASLYVPPTSNADDLQLYADTATNIYPSIPFPHYDGAVPVMSVSSNGWVDLGPTGTNPIAVGVSLVALVQLSAFPTYRCNAIYLPDTYPSPITASGTIWSEEIGNWLYVTWEDVARYGYAGTTETWQLQFNLVTGVVRYVWRDMTPVGGGMIVGYAPGFSVSPPGPLNLPVDLPITTREDIRPMSLTASPDPVSTPTSGTTVTYTLENVPDANVNTGVRVGALAISFGSVPSGVSLAGSGAPGCNLYLQSLDVMLSFADFGNNPTQAISVAIPANVAQGSTLYTQGIALIVPGSLGNGVNAAGITTSNAVESVIGL